jgi:hypothetical protein
MTDKNQTFNDVLGVVGAFVAAHPELVPEKIEFTVATILRFLKRMPRPRNSINRFQVGPLRRCGNSAKTPRSWLRSNLY